jgi:hypothetical protein
LAPDIPPLEREKAFVDLISKVTARWAVEEVRTGDFLLKIDDSLIVVYDDDDGYSSKLVTGWCRVSWLEVLEFYCCCRFVVGAEVLLLLLLFYY